MSNVKKTKSGKALTDTEILIRAKVGDSWNPREINRARADWAKLNAADAEIRRLTQERDELRRICIAAINATDGACCDVVSTDFLALLPREVAGLKDARDEALALVETMRKALASIKQYGCSGGDAGDPVADAYCDGYNNAVSQICENEVDPALATTGPVALAEVRARVFMEAAEMVGHVLDKPEERTARAMAVMTLKGCALNERGAARIRAEAQG